MQKINLRELYPDMYKTDTFLEVTDEVQAVFLSDKRAEAAHERQMYRYKAQYSLDCDNGIEDDVGICDGSGRAQHAEFKLISRKRKRRSAVSVRGINGEDRRFGDADRAFDGRAGNVILAVHDAVHQSAELVSEIYGNDRGRSFVRSQTMVVARRGDTRAQDPLIVIDRRDDAGENQHEQRVPLGVIAGV